MQRLLWQTSVTALVTSTRRSLRQLYARRLEPHGVTPRQMGMLFCLRNAECDSLRTLARRAQMDEPTASRIISRLTARGLVAMAADEADRRCARLGLTSEGKAMARKLEPIARAVEAELREGISDRDRASLERILSRVKQNAKDALEAPVPRKRRRAEEARA